MNETSTTKIGNLEISKKRLQDEVGSLKTMVTIIYLSWFRNRLIYAGLEPVLSFTSKSCIASYYRQFSTNIKINFIKLNQVLLARTSALWG